MNVIVRETKLNSVTSTTTRDRLVNEPGKRTNERMKKKRKEISITDAGIGKLIVLFSNVLYANKLGDELSV